MTYQQIPCGAWILDPDELLGTLNAASFASALIDATGEKFACVGRVWFTERTGTKDIRRVGFRFGSVTKAGGSALTVSLQNPSTTTGPPGQPDETQDQTVAIANADASFASNTWYRTGTLSADRTVSFGEDLAVVIEFDGSGRLGSDAVNINYIPNNGRTVGFPVSKTGGSWSGFLGCPNLVLEFTDGTFGILESSIPTSTFSSAGYNSGSTPDEIALAFQLPFKCKIDGVWACVNYGGTAPDFDVVIYQGTTALQTVSIDGNRIRHGSYTYSLLEVPFEELELAANTQYYAALKPTTTNFVTMPYFDVNAAGHLNCWPGGQNFHQATRVDAGSWSATTTRRPLMGIRLSSFDDGAGGGSPNPFGGSCF